MRLGFGSYGVKVMHAMGEHNVLLLRHCCFVGFSAA